MLARVGQVTYRLERSATFSIHPVFDVSMLKKKIGTGISSLLDFPVHLEDQMVVAPEKVLHTRVITRDGQQVMQGLIKWINEAEEDATWEDRSFFTAQFPEILLSWGQESAQGGVIFTYYRKRNK